MSRAFAALLLTCEHGGKDVPKAYASLFRGDQPVLNTHRGSDLGALVVAKGLAKVLKVPLYFATTTRLLVDLNRSLHGSGVWSPWSRDLSLEEKSRIVLQHYAPYRLAVEQRLLSWAKSGKKILHLSVHSFTPELNGSVRNAEVGILYDPKRAFEAATARGLVDALKAQNASLRVRKNYPYVGYSDGFTTHLRRLLPAKLYAGIEIETKQDEILRAAGQRRFVEIYANAIAAIR